MKENKCKSCIKHSRELEELADENYRLQKLVDFMNTELTDKTELIEEIKLYLTGIHVDDKNSKDIVFKLIARLVK